MPAIIGPLLLTAAVAYLWGSIPSGYWMGKILRGKNFDIRDHGSHKIGATNVQRTLGNIPAIIVLFVDLSKGIGPTLLARFVLPFSATPWDICIAGVLALLGHCYPVFIGFKGGRGVLTGGGALLVISPLSWVICAITTIGTIAIWRYVSLGSIVGCVSTIACGIVFYIVGRFDPSFFGRVSLPELIFMIIAPALVIAFHYDNIGRLLAGKERKFKFGSQEAPSGSQQNA